MKVDKEIKEVVNTAIELVPNLYERVKDLYDVTDLINAPVKNTMSDFVRGHKSKRRKR